MFHTNDDTEKMRIDASGRLLLGVSSDSSTTSMTISGNSTNSAGQAQLHMDLGSTSVSNNTSLGIIRFRATGDNRGADIRGLGDGTWSAGSAHPTRLAFYTNDASSAGTPTERMRIDKDGQLRILTTDTGTASVIIDSQLGGGSALRLIGKSSNDGSEIDFYADNNSTRLGYLEFNNTVTKLVSETAVPLSFYTNGGSNERMRIDTAGRLLLGNYYRGLS